MKSKLRTARYNHTATLLPDGNMLLSGGTDRKGSTLNSGELFNVNTRRFTLIDSEEVSALTNSESEFRNPQLADSLGAVETRIVPAEEGMLGFVTPKIGLLPDSMYSLSVSGAFDQRKNALAPATISFTTFGVAVPLPDLSDPDEEWIPDENNLNGNWRSNRQDSDWRSLKPLQAPPRVTALAGQSLMLNGKPLAEVTLEIATQKTRTDGTGRFLLATVPAGHQVMIIDGRTTNRGAKSYGVFKVGVDIKQGLTNVLPYTIWMSKLDCARGDDSVADKERHGDHESSNSRP